MSRWQIIDGQPVDRPLDAYERNRFAYILEAMAGPRPIWELEEIDESVRGDIFHSTLDWQTRDQLRAAAREAEQLCLAMRRIEPRHLAHLADALYAMAEAELAAMDAANDRALAELDQAGWR